MNYRKFNRENRNRAARMVKRRRSFMPHMDRERRGKMAAHPSQAYSMRYGSEGLTCSLCAQGVWGSLESQTADARAAIAEYKEN